jgi:sugar/nucleoside kinase (ribokinase family)
MKQFDVIGFGALNVDKLFKVNAIAHAEQERFVKNFTEAAGGSAANTIVGLARLDCRTGFIGKTAQDNEGKLLIDDFAREGVNLDGIIRSEKGRTGTVMGFFDEIGQRALYVDPGVNDTIRLEEIGETYASNTKFLHLSSFVGQESFRTQKSILEKIPEEVRVSLDPGALYAERGVAQLEPIIKRSFVVMPNALELEALTGKPDYCGGAVYLLELGVKIVAVKLGKYGCYVTDGTTSRLIKPFKVKVINTTGAGDAFCAGFLYGIINDKPLEECGRIGNFVASRCIMKSGARVGLPHAADLKLLD